MPISLLCKCGILLFLISLHQQGLAQVTGEVNVLDPDVFYMHYTPPNVITDDFEYQRFSGKLSVPPLKNGRLTLYNTFGLDVHLFNYKNNRPEQNSGELNTFYNLNYSLFASYAFSERWSVNVFAAPFLLSNLEGSFEEEDLRFNGTFFIERNFVLKNGGYIRLGLGTAYITLNGTTQITPISQAKARFNEQWSMVLGLPNTYVKWDFHKRNSLKGLFDLNDFSANLNGSSSFGQGVTADRAVFTVVSAGLEYNHWITQSFGLLLRVTGGLWNSYELRNEDNDTAFTFDDDLTQPFVSVGIKFNPVRELQNRLFPSN
ncbi:MAG: hypothetical protein AAFW89_00595 [Bacteroidota bacterium]